MKWILTTNSEEQTERLGRLLAAELVPGMVVGLVGPLGAGKTCFVKGLASALGVDRDDVNSPTFVLIQEYPARIPLYHFDTYRLRDIDEFLELGAEELLAGEGACLIEWADRVADVLPRETLWIEIRLVSPSAREWTFRSEEPETEHLIDRLRQSWESANAGD